MSNLIPLSEWDKINFGGQFSRRQLLSWARRGRFNPKPLKVGKSWFVEKDAKYIPPPPKLMKVEMVEITDPSVLKFAEQLRHGSA